MLHGRLAFLSAWYICLEMCSGQIVGDAISQMDTTQHLIIVTMVHSKVPEPVDGAVSVV